MLADPKADALVENFAGQWLYLRELANVQTEAQELRRQPAPVVPPRNRDALRARSSARIGSLVDLLDADYTFVDERLARHYGIPNVRGSYFRRVPLDPDSPRRGLLGQGSMLTVTSVATRTSPVSRGKWMLENLLGAPPPEPPPGVETNLEQDAEAAKPTHAAAAPGGAPRQPGVRVVPQDHGPDGLRARELRPGRRRGARRDGPAPIDSTGQLADGTPLNGPADLRQAVLSRSDAFMTTATEKLLTYALGRPVHYYDMPTVRAIVRRAGRERQPVLVAGARHRRERRVSEASEEVAPDRQVSRGDRHMAFITKKHLSRRTFLQRRGRHAGAAVPRIDDPRGHGARPDGRRGRGRGFGAIYFPHGAIMPKWTPATEGAGFELTRDPAAAQAVPQPDQRHQRSASTRWPTAAAPRPTTTARPPRS